MKYRILLIACCLVWLAAPCRAAGEGERQFTEEHPLVYEDAWDLWPYVFLNDNGEAVGYNIDLLRLIFKELDIPYVINLKPTTTALQDLKSGRSDLMLGMDAYFHHEYAQYGKSVIQIFTHSVLHRRSEDVKVKSKDDLANNRVIVHESSFSHHLMLQRGWDRNAVPYNDMQEAIHLLHNEPGHQIVWNTMSLKWLINHFHYDELELTPVAITHGEYKFMSNNERLLHQLDSVYTLLNATGRLQPIQNKWFYPERKETGIPDWIWNVIIALLAVTVLALVFYIFYRRQERSMTRTVRRSNNRLALILKTSHVQMWVYHVKSNTITTYDANGKTESDNLSPNFFFYSMRQEDMAQVTTALHEMGHGNCDKQTLNVLSKSGSGGELRNLTIDLSVLRRDRSGRPLDLIGTTSDVTEERRRQQEVRDTMLRYRTIFNSAMVDIVAYDENGVIIDMNEKARRAFPKDFDHILKARITLADVLGMDDVSPENIDYMYLTQLLQADGDNRALARFLNRGKMCYELQLQPVRDMENRLVAVYGTGRNVTEVANSYHLLQQNIQQVQQANNELSNYIRNIDYVLKNGGVRMLTYQLDTHVLNIYSEIGVVQFCLTQTRALSLVSNESQAIALKLFTSMDNHTRTPITATLRTKLRYHGGLTNVTYPLCLYVSALPTYGKDGRLTGYLGMCRDISEVKATEEALTLEAAKAQDVETVKNAFLRNMSYQIRTPLNSVVGFAELFEMEHSPDDENFFIQEINNNSTLLLKLINDILFLSRLDARMIEIKKTPTDFAQIFEVRCQTAWFNYQQPGVCYVAENGYQKLVVDVDEQNLSIVIEKILVNAAQHTTAGEVRASYTYTGEELVMTFQDTGCGIESDRLQHVFDRFASSDGQSAGLGLSISYEMVQQMGGKINIHSELGKGTIVWVSIPCSCSELVRK